MKRPRVKLSTLMLTVLVVAALVNVVVQTSRIRFIRYRDVALSDPPYEPHLALGLAWLAIVVATRTHRRARTREGASPTT